MLRKKLLVLQDISKIHRGLCELKAVVLVAGFKSPERRKMLEVSLLGHQSESRGIVYSVGLSVGEHLVITLPIPHKTGPSII